MSVPIVITGPTASGKTAVAVALARALGGEIISADSRQVYKYLDIGTNKAGAWDARRNVRLAGGVAQHLTDLIEPSESFNAGTFARAAEELIGRMEAAGTVPIIAGGTGLYLKALVDGLAPAPGRDEALRQELAREAGEHGTEHLYRRLLEVDPATAAISRGNIRRIIRALEVHRLTGIPLSGWHARQAPAKRRFAQFGLRWPRTELCASIDRRSGEMLGSGMIEETKRVLDMGFPEHSPGLEGIGYRDVVRYLQGTLDLNMVETLLSRDTRRYAKRQVTWFKRDGRIEWIDTCAAEFDAARIADRIVQRL